MLVKGSLEAVSLLKPTSRLCVWLCTCDRFLENTKSVIQRIILKCCLSLKYDKCAIKIDFHCIRLSKHRFWLPNAIHIYGHRGKGAVCVPMDLTSDFIFHKISLKSQTLTETAPHPDGCLCMMTSSNENNFRVTGFLCGKLLGDRWIPLTQASDAELWCVFLFAP